LDHLAKNVLIKVTFATTKNKKTKK